MKKIYIALLAAAALAGCSKNEGGMEPTPGSDPSGEIRIASAIEASVETKADVSESTALTGIHFLKVDAASKPANMTGAAAFTGKRATGATGAVTWTTAAGGTAADANKPKYDKTANKNAYLVGVYPGPNSTEAPSKGAITTGKVTWTIDGKTDILLSPIWDAGTYAAPLTGSATPKLTFEHQLAQLCVILQAEAGIATAVTVAAWGSITDIALKTLPTATYTYATAEASAVTFSGTAAFKSLLEGTSYSTAFTAKTVPASSNTAVTAAGMFAPSTGVIEIQITSKIGSAAATTHTVSVQLKNTGDVNQNFEKGLTHTVTLTLKAANKEIAVTNTSITAWAKGYDGSGSLEK